MSKYVLTLAKKNGRKFEDEDITPKLREEAGKYLESYEGSFSFLLSALGKHRQKKLTDPMVRGVLNCIVAEGNRVALPKKVKQLVPNGTYTVIFDSKGEDYVTMRLKDSPEWVTDAPEGSQVAQYLYGSDNSRNFSGFAFVNGDKFSVWNKFKNNPRLEKALGLLILSGKFPEYGEKYALKSGRCYRCMKKLTVPASLHRGLGPICAGV